MDGLGIFKWKGTKEQALKVCLHAFFELLNLFEIETTQDLPTRELTVKMTPMELKENSDKLLWLSIFFRYRKEIMELL